MLWDATAHKIQKERIFIVYDYCSGVRHIFVRLGIETKYV